MRITPFLLFNGVSHILTFMQDPSTQSLLENFHFAHSFDEFLRILVAFVSSGVDSYWMLLLLGLLYVWTCINEFQSTT
jgi:hypothetical protein